jgi:hypothetical protein
MQLDHILRRLDFSSLSETERKRYINRIHRIVTIIEAQFPHVSQPEQIRLKHCQYFRNVWLPARSQSESTQREYIRALGLFVRASGRPETWLGALGIKASTGQGGRPGEVGIKRSKKYWREQTAPTTRM